MKTKLNPLFIKIKKEKKRKNDWNYQDLASENIYDGNLYLTGYSVLLYCWNDSTGALEWTFGNGGEGNSTYINQPGFAYSLIPMFLGDFVNGMVYLTNSEHSPNSPLYQGYKLLCVNATTGLEIWSISDFGNPSNGASGAIMPVASGYLVTDNAYDQQLYCYGQGPSQTTVTAPDIGVTTATPVSITGTVMDISAGTKQNEQAADFPNGVPCVSDASMTAFMEAVYMQQPMPTNVTGVPVTLYVLDSNNNYRSIGTTTTNAQGEYGFTWTPDITGNYTVTAIFGGTDAYYGSSASAYFYASSPSATLPPTASPLSGLASNTTVMYAVIAMIIVFVVGIALVLVFVTKKPQIHP